MYLCSLKIKNFRKYKQLNVKFTKGLNLLVGENDSGKTAIVDAIKYVLHTQSFEYIRPNIEDFHLAPKKEESKRKNSFLIECTFKGFKKYEAKSFLEWLGFDSKGDYYLKIWLKASRKNSKVFYEVRAGADKEGSQISGEARDYLRVTYLKPLRDAVSELTPKRGSRLSQILDSHEQFNDKKDHKLKEIIDTTNEDIEKYFSEDDGKDLLKDVNDNLLRFSLKDNELQSKFQVSDNSLKSILEKLSLKLFNHETSENNIQGLGSHNLLYISAELLLLKKLKYSGLKLALVEEIEAHLHPQTQIRLIETIQSIGEENNIQFILTSHSPNLASKVKLKNLIVCKDRNTYPMGRNNTKLKHGDYYFLERFLSSTKANLFFANGVILVEGDAENILIPTLAKLLDKDLSRYGVSIVNVGSTAFLRYANIFLRKRNPKFKIPVSLVTDVDVKPLACMPKDKDGKEMTAEEVEEERLSVIKDKKGKYKRPIKSFVAPYWTLEYSIACSCLSKLFWQAVYICWKTKGKDYVYSKKRKKKLIEEADVIYDGWVDSGYPRDEIAFNVYKEHLLKKQLSKAVVAQVFSQILEGNGLDNISDDEHIAYLSKAINHATGD